MDDTTDNNILVEELIRSQAESSDPAYLSWKKAKIRAAIKQADENPADVVTQDEV